METNIKTRWTKEKQIWMRWNLLKLLVEDIHKFCLGVIVKSPNTILQIDCSVFLLHKVVRNNNLNNVLPPASPPLTWPPVIALLAGGQPGSGGEERGDQHQQQQGAAPASTHHPSAIQVVGLNTKQSARNYLH